MEGLTSLFPLFFIPFISLGLAFLTNFYRELRQYHFALKPNCLLTRKPVVFITGPCSVFYFRKYWNAYPEILAEHGYEVFTLHLPWRGPARLIKMKGFLDQQESRSQQFHFVCDAFSASEMKALLDHSPCVASLTILKSHQETSGKTTLVGIFLQWSYTLHSWSHRSLSLPKAQDLGVQVSASALWLLQEMQEKGERDFLS